MNQRTKSILTKMIYFTAVLAMLTVTFFVIYSYLRLSRILSVAVTMLTVFYHFAMRLVVGETVTLVFRGREFPQERLGFRLYSFEKKLYSRWKVKKWKNIMITAKPEQFDLKRVSPEELLHNVMQAELVHRIIMVLSYVPLLLIVPFGTPAVFVTSSVLASLIDYTYVVIQRYNRPRIIKYAHLVSMQKKTQSIN